MSGLRVWVQGVGLLGPGLSSWAASLDVLRGMQALAPVPTVLPAPLRLPPAERRRAGASVKLALAVADEAVTQAQIDPSALATVFTSSSGEGVNCHALCETLATPAPMVSPTRFTNSVHNAAAGCWHIAVGSRASSTSLCAFDGSFGAGLIEAATGIVLGGAPMLLVASESPYPEPLGRTRPLPDHFGLALVLTPTETAQSIAALSIELVGADQAASTCDDPALEALRRVVPSAAALPLLIALARGGAPGTVVLDYLGTTRLRIELR
jgi:hypothetical protein